MATLLVADAAGLSTLIDRLKLRVDRVEQLPPIPVELDHVRDIAKLQALKIAGANAIHIDFDVFLRKPLPAEILAADFAGEFFYPTRPFLHRVNDSLKVARHQPPPVQCLAGGIMGGQATERIHSVIDRSLAVALDPLNREALTLANGYQASVLIGEAAFAAEFPDAAILLPHANQNRQDYIDRGYVHLAGNKDNPTKLHHVSEMVREDFPTEYASTFHGFAGLRK